MGQLFSREAFDDLIDETVKSDADELSTPPHAQHGAHVLDKDPRSPSCNVTRTPIEVEDTPKRANKNSDTSCTSGDVEITPKRPMIAQK